MSSPYVIVLSEAEGRVLTARVASGRTEYRDRLRAQIVLDAARGVSNAGIAQSRNVCVDTVRTWRRRFAAERLKGLTDHPRSGRPPVHDPVVRAEVIALACTLPAEHDVPLSRWSCPEIARELGRIGQHPYIILSAPEAKEYGIIDEVLTSLKAVPV